jgi:hypothetical protein
MDKTTERVPGSSIDDLQKLSIEELTDEEIVAILRARFKSKFALVAYERMVIIYSFQRMHPVD